MPFTLSHPAAVLPLARRGLPLSALVVGSMMPDLPYFVFLSTSRQFGHSLTGIFYFCVPAGLMLLFLYHRLLKEPTLLLLPAEHRRKLRLEARQYAFWPLPGLLKVCAALAIGALTHLVWDSFTHAGGWTVRYWPLLDSTFGQLPLYKYLQHGGSVIGFGLLVLFYWHWWCSAPESETSEPHLSRALRRRWIIGSAVLPIILGSIDVVRMIPYFPHVQIIVRELVIVGTALVAVEWMVFCLWWHLRAARA